MVDVDISDSGYRTGKQPTHGPYGGKDADLLSNEKAATIFPPKAVKAIPKPNTEEP